VLEDEGEGAVELVAPEPESVPAAVAGVAAFALVAVDVIAPAIPPTPRRATPLNTALVNRRRCLEPQCV
jgi:hypothetical protein